MQLMVTVRVPIVLLLLFQVSASMNSTEVIIIGGGLAGLMAAWQLKVANVDFLLLESRSELGGRVMTRDFSDSSGSHPINVGPRSISTGAKWIHGACSKNPALTLARRYNVATKKMDFDNVAVYRESKDDFCATDDEDCTKPYNKIAKALEDVHENQDGGDSSENLKDRLLNNGWNSDTGLNSDLKKAYQWYNVEYEYAAPAEELAASQTTLKVYENEGGTEELVTSSDGFKKLITQIAAEIGVKECTDSSTKVRCSSIVTKVSYGQGVTVTVKNALTNTMTEIAANCALVTVSLGVLQNKKIEFDPPLSTAKQEAIRKFGMGTLTTVFAKFEYNFWSRQLKPLFSGKKKPVQNIIAASYYPAYSKAHINLAAFNPLWKTLIFSATGTQASSIERQSDSENKADVMNMLRNMYGHSIPDNPINFHVPRWKNDSNFYGAYSFWPVDFTEDDHVYLRLDEGGELFFAGEATSKDFFGFLQGAICTGLDQADAIISKMGVSNVGSSSVLNDVKSGCKCEDSSSWRWWHYLLIALGCPLAIIIIIIIGCICCYKCKKKCPGHERLNNPINQ